VTDSLKQGVPSPPGQVKKQTVLTPELKAFIDRAVVPALVREYLAQERKVNPVAPISASVDNWARTLPSAEESTL
jgi:hypothetical protein